MGSESDKSRLEALPPEILIRILCNVNHDDLKQALQVSRTIKEAVLIAKNAHFAYLTPSKVRAFRNSVDPEDPCGLEEMEAPNAPKRPTRTRPHGKNLEDISVKLFQFPDEKLQSKQRVVPHEIENIGGRIVF